MQLELLKDRVEEIEKCRDESFDLGSHGVNDQDVEALVNALNKNSKIKDLDLSRNNISSEGVKSLLKLKYIKIINLKQNNVYDEDALKLAKKFDHIILIQNPLSKDGKGVKEILDCKETKFSKLIVEDEHTEGGAMKWLPENIRKDLRQRNKLEFHTDKENVSNEKSDLQIMPKDKKSGSMVLLAETWAKLRGPSDKSGTIDNTSSSSFKSEITK